MTLFRRDICLGLALGLFVWTVWAADSARPLALTGEPSQSLAGYLSVLADVGDVADLKAARDAADGGRFRMMSGGNFSFGTGRNDIWLRFALANPTAIRQERWLALDNALLPSVILHSFDEDGMVDTAVSGTVVPVERRTLGTGKIVLPVVLAPGQTKTAYLHISGSMVMVSTMMLWQPAAYLEAEWRRMALKAAVIGGSTTVVFLCGLILWRANRRLSLLGVVFADILFGMAAFAVDGVAAPWVPANYDMWQVRIAGVLSLLALGLHAVFARAFLDLPKHAPRLAMIMAVLAVLSPLAALAVLAVPGVQAIIGTILAITAAASAVVAIAAWRGIRNASLYLAAWCGLLSVFVIILAGGLLKVNTAAYLSMAPLASFLIASLILAFIIYRQASVTKQASERTHQHLLELRRTEQERLTQAVEARTRELREAKAQAEEAGKARLAFLSTVSHELRTPLHTILGYAQLLQRRNGRREADAKLATIESSGLQLLRLIDDILEFIRGDSHAVALKPAPLALADLVRQIGDTGQVLALARHNRFRVDLVGELPATVEVDGRRLQQVLDNLISNGCKYTSNGSVTMRIEPEKAENGEPPPAGMRRFRFTVEDTGVGIPVDQQARLFQPFSRLVDHEYQPGIGLGLAIARQIVRAMGSDIGVDSAPGRGSRFHFALTLRTGAGEAVDAAAAMPQIVGYDGPRRTLLVADDIAENRQFLGDLCSEWGFEVLTAGDGAEALALCRRADRLPDCMLIDQFMPGIDGWAFLRELRVLPGASSLPVILVSAACPERPNGLPAEIAFDGVLLKPIRQHELAESLQRLLGLEWKLDQTSRVVPAATPSTTLPPANELAALREMLSLGRVVAIQRWALHLAETRPDVADFAREAARLAEAVNLPGLELLLQRAEGVVRASMR